jgi:hypothetical protein
VAFLDFSISPEIGRKQSGKRANASDPQFKEVKKWGFRIYKSNSWDWVATSAEMDVSGRFPTR